MTSIRWNWMMIMLQCCWFAILTYGMADVSESCLTDTSSCSTDESVTGDGSEGHSWLQAKTRQSSVGGKQKNEIALQSHSKKKKRSGSNKRKRSGWFNTERMSKDGAAAASAANQNVQTHAQAAQQPYRYTGSCQYFQGRGTTCRADCTTPADGTTPMNTYSSYGTCTTIA